MCLQSVFVAQEKTRMAPFTYRPHLFLFDVLYRSPIDVGLKGPPVIQLSVLSAVIQLLDAVYVFAPVIQYACP